MKRKPGMAKSIGCLFAAMLSVAAGAYAAAQVRKYSVHDMNRPRPPVVKPDVEIGQPPSDAIVLFNGTDLSQWQKGDGSPATWEIVDDYMTVARKAGSIQTKRSFGSCQLHVEWRTPEGVPPRVTGQNRSNSGVFFMGRYEVQILDSYTDDDYQTNKTYAYGLAAAIYG